MFPPRVILAAVDFSEPSRVALTCATRLATHCGARLHVVHAEDPFLASAAESSGVDLAAETRSELETFMQSARPAGDLAPQDHVVVGHAVDVIRDVARHESADLIVVGAHGMSGVERLFFGSTTEGILRHADTSVLVVPNSWSPPRPDAADLTGTGPVVAGFEPSPAGIAAVKAGAALANLLQTSLDVVHVVPPPRALTRWSRHAEKATTELTEAARSHVASALRQMEGLSASVDIRVGSVAECLAQAAASTGGRRPILVLGRRTPSERGGAPGSVASRVLTETDALVLMHLPAESGA